MSGLSERIQNDGERHVQASMNAEVAGREERWEAERADRDGLRASLEGDVSDIYDAPKKRPPKDDPDATIRDEASRAWDTLMGQGALADIEKREFDEFRRLGKLVKNKHGVDSPTEAFQRLMEAEEALRTNPEGALQFLAQSYMTGQPAQDVARREQQAALSAVEQFFTDHEIGPADEALILHAIKSPDFRRTGDFEADLQAAYKATRKGRDHVSRIR